MYLTHYDIFCESLSSPPLNPTIPLTLSLGHAANAYSVMAVESSVGIACGCLPGCKPLLSRLFPRVFGTNSSSNSNSRTPKTPLSSSGASFPLQSLARDVILKEEGYRVEYEDADARKPLPSTPLPVYVHSRRGSLARRFSFPVGRAREGDEGREGYSSESQELIILQGVEELKKKCYV